MKFSKIKIAMNKVDVFLMVLFPVIATIITLIFKTNLFVSTLLFFGIPPLYLIKKRPKILLRALPFIIIFALPFTFMIDYLGVKDGSWYVPYTVFGLRLFGVVAIEDLVWTAVLVLFGITFYEFFLDFTPKKDFINQRLRYWKFPLILLLIFFLFFFFAPNFLEVQYLYLKTGIVLIFLPLILFLLFYPKFLIRFVKATIYFFPVCLLFELTGLYMNQWTFPGQNFIGFIELFGLKFPFEEFFFFIIFGAGFLLSFYEFFADDRQ